MFPSRRIATMGGNKFRDEYSLAFDSTDDYVYCGLSNAFITGNTVTLSCWAKVTDTHAGYLFANVRASSSSNFSLIVNKDGASSTAGHITGIVYTGSAVAYTAYDGNVDDSQWHHYAFTTSSSAQVLYLDGVAVTTTSNVFANTASASLNTSIGNLTGGSAYLGGNISEVALYNSTLTASQVKTLYNGREPYNHKEGIATGNLTAWYRMGDGRFDQFASEGIFGGDTGLMTNEVNPTKGVDLFDSGVGDYSSSTGAWAVDGTNTIENDSGAVKITYDNDADGARLNLNDAADLTTDLTVGKTYELTFAAKINTGSVTVQLNDGAGTFKSFTINITDWLWKKHYFICQHATNCQLKQSGMGAGEIIWIKNVRLKEAGSNSGVMTNMAEGDIVGDTP